MSQRPPWPTDDDYCASGGHAYYGDDGPPPPVETMIADGLIERARRDAESWNTQGGRCWCGRRSYPARDRVEVPGMKVGEP